ncbi:Bug family tripartite tricarboxylate transporter substrate binding protein [Neoroseomonas oryzicola]|uniref:Tripartite tricarboxylate transporter substrate binding protein n=1 Tax=Neoroseomonas oryzicola TaxID=535904 RepID=A0A9X9WJM6_9PROT|nr:tripartite tricarboxylate transporter substrate binding protein [Neoroseomonas oryzicola]MBR0660536.1 tripartite tricarboxylate transporter substrate binding protein [Neoroseomonas oryzicola]NKE16778.1 tripartite tricarboxylate transporter substrate binding protein [Neoroseomonas oryzicola]
MKRLFAAAAALLLGCAVPARAQDFPNRQISMIVVFAPGGATDVLARIAAEHMSRTLGRSVVVENVSGAGGTIGGARGAQAAPDGYTLTVGSLGSHSAAPSIYRSIAYDPRELQPIGLIAGTPLYFVVRNGFPAQTMQEFLAHVRANPGRVSNGHAGIGSTNHLACALFAHLTGAQFNNIPYRGEGPAVNDIVAQQVDSACVLAPAAVPQIQAGTMRGLLTAAATRNPNAPNVPSAAEAGVPDYIFQGWNAVFAPRGTPAPVVAKLDGALRAALADPAIRQRIEALGSIPAAPDQQGPEALARLVRSEVDRWSTVVRAAGIEPQ